MTAVMMVRVFVMGAGCCGHGGGRDAGVRVGCTQSNCAQIGDIAAGHGRPRQTGDGEEQEAWRSQTPKCCECCGSSCAWRPLLNLSRTCGGPLTDAPAHHHTTRQAPESSQRRPFLVDAAELSLATAGGGLQRSGTQRQAREEPYWTNSPVISKSQGRQRPPVGSWSFPKRGH